MNSNIHCPRCGWRVSREDRFCGSCAYKLVILKVSPDPDEDLGGRAGTIFDGIPIALKLKCRDQSHRNFGVVGIRIRDYPMARHY